MALTLLGARGGSGGTGSRGPAGPPGTPGAAGRDGLDGKDGQPRFSGFGPPPNVIMGFDPTRDVYLDRTTGLLYVAS